MKGFDTDGEGVVGVARAVDLAVDGSERDAEQRGIDLAELGDVIGGLARGQVCDALMQLREVILHRRERRGGLGISHRSDGIHFVQRDPQINAIAKSDAIPKVQPLGAAATTLGRNHAMSKSWSPSRSMTESTDRC